MKRILIFFCLMVALESCSGFEFKLENNSVYDVTMGEEKVLIFNLSRKNDDVFDNYGFFCERYYGDILEISKNGSSVPNLYQYRSVPKTNMVMLYFPKITKENLGLYRVIVDDGNNTVYEFTLIEAESEANPTNVLIYISPAVSVAVCLIVIITVVCITNKTNRTKKEKLGDIPTAKKNYYTNSNNAAPEPRKVTSQRLPLTSTSSQALLHKTSNSDSPPPPVSRRTTSLHSAFRASAQVPVAGHTNVLNHLRRSMESLNSFEDDAEHEITARPNFKPPHFFHAPPSSMTLNNHHTQYSSSNVADNKRRTSTFPTYVNQSSTLEVDDQDYESFYEEM